MSIAVGTVTGGFDGPAALAFDVGALSIGAPRPADGNGVRPPFGDAAG